MASRKAYFIPFVLFLGQVAAITLKDCKTLARTESGWVCGKQRETEDGGTYDSFRGIPYAKQPLGELRFKELQPAEKWRGVLNATVEGPVCPYHDIFYGPLFKPQGVSEACIHVNVHVPSGVLPKAGRQVQARRGLPIFLFIHGGAWVSGSGDADMHGPEYLIGKDVIVITFNYRTDVFGFLSLNTAKIPGNNGLRDMVTLLRWVRRNARYFGGNPDQVTVVGQSAGATSAHLLSLSSASKGLFNRLWLISGTAIQSFYSSTQALSGVVADAFLTILGLNGTDPDIIHDKLIKMPLEEITTASGLLQDQFPLTTFIPVAESSFTGVTPILTDDPEKLLAKGVGKDIPTVIGFSNAEAETVRPRLVAVNIMELLKINPLVTLSPHLAFTLPPEVSVGLAEKISKQYFEGEPTLDKFIKLCTDQFWLYPAIKLARDRAALNGAPVYLYKFAYNADYSPFKQALNLTFEGTGHVEDLSLMFKINSWPSSESARDDSMKDWMSGLVTNYVKKGYPGKDKRVWPPVSRSSLKYNIIDTPQKHQITKLTAEDQKVVEFFDNLVDG